MGKPNKKANVEVTAATVSVSPTKEAKKGKRGAEEAPEKRASPKKQKIEAEQMGENKKKAKKLKKVLIKSSGEKKDEDMSSDFEEQFAAAPIGVPPAKATTKVKRRAEVAPENQASSKSHKIEVEVGQNKKKDKKLNKALIEQPTGKKKDETRSFDFEIENPASSKSQKIEAEVKKNKKKAKRLNKALIEQSPGEKKDETRNFDFEVEISATSSCHLQPVDSSQRLPSTAKGFQPGTACINELPYAEHTWHLPNQKNDNKRNVSFPGDAKNEEISRISKKEPETFANRDEVSGIKRLFVGNLPSEVIKDDLLDFFKKAGEVTEVRLAANEDGSFRGFGHVEFVTEADAQKACRMNGQLLLGRPLIVDLAREIGSHKPHDGKESGSYRIGVQDPGHSVYVKGFGKSHEEDQIRKSLMEHFGSCGEIIRLSIPQDNKTHRSKGFAYVMFNDQATVSKALELNGTEFGGHTLTVEEPAPKSGPRDCAYSGGRGTGGRSTGHGRGHDGNGRGRGRVGPWTAARSSL